MKVVSATKESGVELYFAEVQVGLRPPSLPSAPRLCVRCTGAACVLQGGVCTIPAVIPPTVIPCLLFVLLPAINTV